MKNYLCFILSDYIAAIDYQIVKSIVDWLNLIDLTQFHFFGNLGTPKTALKTAVGSFICVYADGIPEF